MAVPSHPSPKETTSVSIQLVGVVAFLLLVFAVGFLIVYPTQEKPSFSEMYWSAPPVVVADANETFLTFGVQVNSREQDVTTYHLVARVEGNIVMVKDFALTPGANDNIAFRIPLDAIPNALNEVRVTLTRTELDDAGKSRRVLEIVDWFSDENVD